MKIVLSGSTGFVGSHLLKVLRAEGHEVVRLVRRLRPAAEPEVQWDPGASRLHPAGLEGADAFIHLAGESVMGRWTARKKDAIRDSRLRGTRLLAETAARLSKTPKVFICASAVGYYGDRGGETLTEESAPGTGFLPQVCRAWEAACAPAAEKGIRVVNLRIGMVLGRSGGALGAMLLPFQLGLGGRLGTGQQYMSWISVDDLAAVVLHALETKSLSGPVNAVSPKPVTNEVFTKTLGRVLRRPTVFPVPAFLIRLLFGGLADELLLASGKVEPARLKASGFRFSHASLEPALRSLLAR